MNRDECPSSQDGVAEILKITKELLDLANSNPKISSWDKYNWIFAIAAGLGGIVAAPFSAGLSLSITIASIGWVGVDIIKKIRESSGDKVTQIKLKQHSDRLIFLERCLKQQLD